MTFPIDFWQHPKVAPLPVDAKWAFVEMNGYSRMNDLDGVIPVATARHMWKPRVLAALVGSHPERPLVYLDALADVYVIRDYAEHQETTGSIEARRRRNTENGKKGGRPSNRNVTQSVTDSVTGSGADAKAESRVQSPEDLTQTSPRQSYPTRARETTDSIPHIIQRRISQYGITSIDAVVDCIAKHVDRQLTPIEALQVSAWILDKAKSPKVPQRYVTGSISRSPAEVQKFIDDNALGAAS
jgi:hypothetical protein